MALPEENVQILKQECDGALSSAVSSPSKPVKGYSFPIVALQKRLDLYANISQINGLFRSMARDALAASRFLSVGIEEQIIDSMGYKLFRQPETYDVIVAPNLYGDILSNGAGALAGSLGLIPSANVGEGFAIGEPCHGSAPDIMGQNTSNPIATLRTIAQRLC